MTGQTRAQKLCTMGHLFSCYDIFPQCCLCGLLRTVFQGKLTKEFSRESDGCVGHWLIDDGGSNRNKVDFMFYRDALGSQQSLFLFLEC